MKSNKQKRI